MSRYQTDDNIQVSIARECREARHNMHLS